MRPDQVLSFRRNGNQIIVNGVGTNVIKLLGSSVTCSLRPGDSGTFFVLEPERPGVVAISVEAHNNVVRHDKWASVPKIDFFLNVIKKGDGESAEFVIDSDNHGVTMPGRLGKINNNDRLDVIIDGQLFVSKKPYDLDKCGTFRLVDGSILCQYLAGDIDAEAVKAAASKVEAKQTAEERVKELESELANANSTICQRDQELKEAWGAAAAEKEKAEAEAKKTKKAEAETEEMKKYWSMTRTQVNDLLRCLFHTWLVRKSVKKQCAILATACAPDIFERWYNTDHRP